MDIHTVRQQLRTRTIYDLPLRVTFYARVSSESDEQLNSLGNQIQYYRELIQKNANWTYVEGYIDEGLSAATTKKREHFHRMVEDGERGLFDLVITKEITRFARNTLDSIQYTRRLLSAGVGVFFSERQHQHPGRGQRAAADHHVGHRPGRAAQAVQPREVRPPAGHPERGGAGQQPHLRLPQGRRPAGHR